MKENLINIKVKKNNKHYITSELHTFIQFIQIFLWNIFSKQKSSSYPKKSIHSQPMRICKLSVHDNHFQVNLMCYRSKNVTGVKISCKTHDKHIFRLDIKTETKSAQRYLMGSSFVKESFFLAVDFIIQGTNKESAPFEL